MAREPVVRLAVCLRRDCSGTLPLHHRAMPLGGALIMVDVLVRSPTKTREFHNHHFDSTIWNDFRFRYDDIIVASYAKSGTTWLQQILGQLVFEGAEDLNISEMSPWLDLRMLANAGTLQALE